MLLPVLGSKGGLGARAVESREEWCVEPRKVRALVGARGGDVAVKPGVGRPGNGRPYEGSSLFRGAQDWERKTRKTH